MQKNIDAKLTGVIGLSAFARSGKDLFFKILNKKVDCVRIALADELKAELQPVIQSKYGFDILNCTPEQKEIARPSIVSYAKTKRDSSGGTYWYNKINDKVNQLKDSTLVVITDIRYNQYEKDEVYWVKEILSGTLVHIKKYDVIDGKKVFSSAPNDEELINDPLVYNSCDYKIEWPDSSDRLFMLEDYVDNFLTWYATRKIKKNNNSF